VFHGIMVKCTPCVGRGVRQGC